MKRPLVIGIIVLAVLVGALVYFGARGFAAPRFVVINNSPIMVTVKAHWRDREMVVAELPPASRTEFTIRDEAAVRFSAQRADGRMLQSEAIYFTSGTVVIAEIGESGIAVRYDFDS